MTKQETKRMAMSQAMFAAAEYAKYDGVGDVVLRDQAERTIIALVGRHGSHGLVIPAKVRAAMKAVSR